MTLRHCYDSALPPPPSSDNRKHWTLHHRTALPCGPPRRPLRVVQDKVIAFESMMPLLLMPRDEKVEISLLKEDYDARAK